MKKILFLALASAFLLSTCSTDTSGNLKLYLTDLPIPNAEKILVNISEINVHKTGGAFLTVWTGSKEYDLLKLRNEEKIILDKELEEGMYTQIRLVIEKGQVVVDSATHDMTIPSSEVKIPVVFNILKGGVTEIILDFETDHSIEVVKTGQSEQYILRPVIKVKSINY
jgi:hypothetical protein